MRQTLNLLAPKNAQLATSAARVLLGPFGEGFLEDPLTEYAIRMLVEVLAPYAADQSTRSLQEKAGRRGFRRTRP